MRSASTPTVVATPMIAEEGFHPPAFSRSGRNLNIYVPR